MLSQQYISIVNLYLMANKALVFIVLLALILTTQQLLTSKMARKKFKLSKPILEQI